MSIIEMKSEVIRLVNELDADRMEDLLFSVKALIEQQEDNEIDTDTPEITESLQKSLNDIGKGKLLSNDEVLKDTKEWLAK